MKGIPRHVFLTAFSFCPSFPLSWGLSLAKTHGAWFQDPMELRFLVSYWKKFSENTATGKRWVCLDSERPHSKSVGHQRGVAMECDVIIWGLGDFIC